MKSLEKVIIVFMVLCLIMALANCVFNVTSAEYSWTQEITKMDTTSGNTTLDDRVGNIVESIISVTRIIAVGVAIIMLTVLAMKYMMSAPGDRADIKKHAVIYVVGAVVLFAASGILTIIAQFASNIGKSSAS